MNEEHAVRALLYDSGELRADERAGFEAHLPACAECRETLSLAARGSTWGRAAQVGPAPETLASVFARPRPRAAALWRWAGATAFAAVSLAAVALLERPAPDLSWESDLPRRIEDLQRRLGDARARASEIRSGMQEEGV